MFFEMKIAIFFGEFGVIIRYRLKYLHQPDYETSTYRNKDLPKHYASTTLITVLMPQVHTGEVELLFQYSTNWLLFYLDKNK